jgi:hypothetical protein
MAGVRGRFGGGCRTSGGDGVWAERRAEAAPPAAVVEEGGWARSVAGASRSRSHGWFAGDEENGEEPMGGTSVEADPVAADPVAEVPPEPGGTGRRRG